MSSPQLLWDTAQAVSEHLTGGGRQRRKISLPPAALQQLQALGRRLALTRARNWHTATARLHRRLIVDLERIRTAFHRSHANHPASTAATASPDDLYQDLAALVEEFVEVEITPEQYRITVTTAPIVLAGLDLGSFEIWLDWGAIGQRGCYRVRAAVPYPPASDECVTHPYVRNDILCAGNAERSIELALAQGRLFDFFTLVRQLLVHYVPGALVQIDYLRWTPGAYEPAASTAVPGDFDSDGDVDGADFVAWQTHFPLTSGATLADGDADNDGDVDGADFVVWQTHFPTSPAGGVTTIPEPSSILLIILAGIGVTLTRRRKC